MSEQQRKILRKLERHRDELRRYGVRRLGLFGSQAAGYATRRSDLDFLVEFRQKSFDAYMDVKVLLERLFRRRVDLVIKEALKPRLKAAILSEVIHPQGL